MADICETGMDLWPFASLPKGVLMGWPKLIQAQPLYYTKNREKRRPLPVVFP